MSELGAVFKGRVISGKLTFEPLELARWRFAVSSLPGNVEIIIRRPVKDRSLDQNAYYWGVVMKLIAESYGHSAQELHEHFKKSIIGGRSTTTLTTEEFSNYIEQIRVWAGENNIIIPDPEHVDYKKD